MKKKILYIELQHLITLKLGEHLSFHSYLHTVMGQVPQETNPEICLLDFYWGVPWEEHLWTSEDRRIDKEKVWTQCNCQSQGQQLMAHQLLLTEASEWLAIHQKLNQEMSCFLEQSVSSEVAVLFEHRQFLGRLSYGSSTGNTAGS